MKDKYYQYSKSSAHPQGDSCRAAAGPAAVAAAAAARQQAGWRRAETLKRSTMPGAIPPTRTMKLWGLQGTIIGKAPGANPGNLILSYFNVPSVYLAYLDYLYHLDYLDYLEYLYNVYTYNFVLDYLHYLGYLD